MSANAIADKLLDIGEEALTLVGLTPDVKGDYHGPPPEQCCTDEGSLYVYWNEAYIHEVQGTFPTRHRGSVVAGPQVWTFRLRWWRCFPVVQDNGSFDQAEASSISSDFTTGGEAILCALAREVCRGSSLHEISGCGWIQVDSLTVVRPQGGCAGIDVGVTMGNKDACEGEIS